MRRYGAGAVVAIALIAVTGCGQSDESADAEWRSYPPGTVVDYQLGGAYDPPPGVGGVVRDSTDPPAVEMYSICYVNGFQTQPADSADWFADRRGLLLASSDRQPLIDPNWPDEYILDTSSGDNRAAILAAIAPTIELCAQSGFDAIEIDNLDSFSRSGGALSIADAIALATSYADLAHSLGLAIAQKNTSEMTGDSVAQIGFDFAIAEECVEFDECAAYTSVYGDAVIDIEYADAESSFDTSCSDPEAPVSTILRDRELSTPDEPSYVFDRC